MITFFHKWPANERMYRALDPARCNRRAPLPKSHSKHAKLNMTAFKHGDISDRNTRLNTQYISTFCVINVCKCVYFNVFDKDIAKLTAV